MTDDTEGDYLHLVRGHDHVIDGGGISGYRNQLLSDKDKPLVVIRWPDGANPNPPEGVRATLDQWTALRALQYGVPAYAVEYVDVSEPPRICLELIAPERGEPVEMTKPEFDQWVESLEGPR